MDGPQPPPRLNEKRGPVSLETAKDRAEAEARLAGLGPVIEHLKRKPRERFRSKSLKTALLEYLIDVGSPEGIHEVSRLAVRHLDVLVWTFMRWRPDETADLLAPPAPEGRHDAQEGGDDFVLPSDESGFEFDLLADPPPTAEDEMADDFAHRVFPFTF
jgi:hypothetical protein